MKTFHAPWKNSTLELKCKKLLLFCVSFYRVFLSIHLGGACRFAPSCSVYAQEVLKNCSLKQALVLIMKRLMACRFKGSFGLHPPPPPQRKR